MDKRDKKQLETVLDECIERMEHGASIEDCLESFPQYAQELHPLLTLTQGLKESLKVAPSASARSLGRSRLMAEVSAQATRKTPRMLSWFGPMRGWATAGALAVIVFVGGFGVVQASSDTVPGQTLYPVKRTVERARLAWPFQSREEKASLSAELAVRRADEMAALARDNKTYRLADLAEKLDVHLARAADLSLDVAGFGVRNIPEKDLSPEALQQRQQTLRRVAERLERDYTSGLERLQAIALNAPPEARPQIRQAAERLQEHYLSTLERMNRQLDLHAQPSRGPTNRDGSQRQAPQTRGDLQTRGAPARS